VSDGKSGCFFCVPPDKKFMIKMVYLHEAEFLKKILHSLSSYYMAEKNTLVVKFYGFHGIQLPNGDMVHVVVMANIFNTTLKMDKIYDLKGSWINRKRDDKSLLGLDLNLDRKIKFPEDVKAMFLGQISRDSTFLSSLDIMDYSLLLGFHFRNTPQSPEDQGRIIPGDSSWRHGILSEDKAEIYFMGIIDILQEFNLLKKLEFVFKTTLLRYDRTGLSAVPPLQYSRRFLKAMQNIVHYNLDAEENWDYGFQII